MKTTGTARVPGASPPSRRVPCDVPLTIEAGRASASPQPVAAGVPFPSGVLRDPSTLALIGPGGRRLPFQGQTLARWPDGSVKWLLVDSVLGATDAGTSRLSLTSDPAAGAGPGPRAGRLSVRDDGGAVVVETGAATFRVGPGGRALFRASIGGCEAFDPGATGPVLTDGRGRRRRWEAGAVTLEAAGPVRATVRVVGRFEGSSGLRFSARLAFFAGTGLVRVRTTLHNPGRARHAGGLWDLGDAGSRHFRDLSLAFALDSPGEGGCRVDWSAEAGRPTRTAPGGVLEIYQDSSGGPNWDGRNHVDRHGRVACGFRGYREREVGRERSGLRASPTVTVAGPAGRVTAAVPEFWEQFPKAVEADGPRLTVRLFPGQCSRPFELQGGERKTDTFWLDLGGGGEGPPAPPLDWAHGPARVLATPGWSAGAGVVRHAPPAPDGPGGRLEEILAGALDGEAGLAARREAIDEYGWRNYGELYADHEAAHHAGPGPVVSHYNNQYDPIYGMSLQLLRTGDPRWLGLLDPLARHVMDIDIYHTGRDRPAYSGGLFWHTDHYRDAATATHRCYSRANRGAAGRRYGGGPCAEHNYTTGLLHYHYLTGDPDARDAVTGLADWVVRMDDGGLTLLGIVDDGPTGMASRTLEPGYHGPGRGCGNSVNALVDAWLLTGRRAYLEKAESLIRRAVHPADDVAAAGLRDVERRWSYTVFLSVLARYLGVKAEGGEVDAAYAYARESLLTYAGWMLGHEVPYFDRPEQLEYPTETWAAQEFRKANVLRLAAEHAEEPLRSRLLRRGGELADRAWDDLRRFESRGVARALAIVLTEGPRDAHFRARPAAIAPRPAAASNPGAPGPFVPQKARVLALVRTPRGCIGAMARLADARRWWRLFDRRRARPPGAP